jgi:hypothetical protein
VTVLEGAGPNVRIVRVDAPREVPSATAIHVDAVVEGAGVAGRTTHLAVRIGGLEVGRASHQWTSDREHWRAGIDVVPVGEPPFALRVEATPADDEADPQDNVADTSVDVRRSAFRIQVYEPRPSWAATFVRRALEADPRFQVASLGFTSRGVSATTRDGVRPDDPRLDSFDVVVAGGVDRLSARDVRSLDRFMRERGGAVVLVPDMKIGSWPVRDLLPFEMTERLLERPATLNASPPLAALEASELLVASNPAPGSQVVAATGGADTAAIVVSMPHGDGRLLVSGAMDAWRFRAAGASAFDRFWQATIAGLAVAAPPPIEVSVEPPLLRPGEQGEVIVRMRSSGHEAVRASIDGQPIRLRPQPEAGAFRGTFTANAAPGRSTIEVHAAGAQALSASRTLLVMSDARRAMSAAPSLAMLASSHGGIDVGPERIADVERFVRSAAASPRTTVVRHPMRSMWWIVPFAACLCAEWWLRRRRGLR